MWARVFAAALHMNVGQAHKCAPAGVREGNTESLRTGNLIRNHYSLWVQVWES